MTTPRRFRVAVFATAAGLFGAACGGGSADSVAEPQATTAPVETAVAESPAATDAAVTDATTDTTSEAATDAVPSILQFTNALIGGGELDASTLADKPTVFWFWSPN